MKELEAMFNKLPMAMRVIALMVGVVFVFGVFGPSLISSNSTLAVWTGIVVCLVAVYVVYRLGRPILDVLKTATKEK